MASLGNVGRPSFQKQKGQEEERVGVQLSSRMII